MSEKCVVEAIVGERIKKGIRQYRIKWLNWDHRYDKWTDEDQIDAPDLLAEFRERQKAEKARSEGDKKNKKENKLPNWGVQPIRKAKQYPGINLAVEGNETSDADPSPRQNRPVSPAPSVRPSSSGLLPGSLSPQHLQENEENLLDSWNILAPTQDAFFWPDQPSTGSMRDAVPGTLLETEEENSQPSQLRPASDCCPDVYFPLGISAEIRRNSNQNSDPGPLPKLRLKFTTPRHATLPGDLGWLEDLEDEFCLEKEEPRPPSPFSTAFEQFRRVTWGKSLQQTAGQRSDQGS